MINYIEQYVKEKLKGDKTGHDWHHIDRVRGLAVTIAKQENANVMICELSALLHDVIDDKLSDNIEKQQNEVRKLLNTYDIDDEDIQHIFNIMTTMSFSYQLDHDVEHSLEGKIVQDADRLDAMGAIGIARAMLYGASKQHVLYDDTIIPMVYSNKKAYRQSQSTIINHFYEKLLLLKDTMYTKTAKEIAEHRHRVMVDFLDEFKQEWYGKK